MQTSEFLRRARQQPVVTLERAVHVHGPTLRARLRQGGLPLSDVLDHPDQHVEQRTFRYGHLLGPGLPVSVIDDWQSLHPDHPLPKDLREFLAVVDGVHLWADLGTLRSYFGILPLSGWRDAAASEWSAMFTDAPVGQLVVSYHDNGEYALVLDTLRREYHWHDHEDFDNFELAGSSVEELLDFWWAETAWLDPGRRKRH